MASPQGLPKSARLLRRPEFRRVFDLGRSSSDGRLVVYARPRDEPGPSRLGLVVGRKFGPAHRRNLFKRRVRHAFRTQKGALPESHDLIVLPGKSGDSVGYAEIEASIRVSAARAARAFAAKGPRR